MFKDERDWFFEQLSKISFLRVIPSQANYFLCEVIENVKSTQLAVKLLEEFEILIKDCSNKVAFENSEKQYIRLAVRDRKDNCAIIKAFNKIKYEEI